MFNKVHEISIEKMDNDYFKLSYMVDGKVFIMTKHYKEIPAIRIIWNELCEYLKIDSEG